MEENNSDNESNNPKDDNIDQYKRNSDSSSNENNNETEYTPSDIKQTIQNNAKYKVTLNSTGVIIINTTQNSEEVLEVICKALQDHFNK